MALTPYPPFIIVTKKEISQQLRFINFMLSKEDKQWRLKAIFPQLTTLQFNSSMPTAKSLWQVLLRYSFWKS